MPEQNHQSPDSLSIVVFSGDFDKVHYALVMASAAAAINKPTQLFFTMDACTALLKADGDGAHPWQAMPVSSASYHTGGDMDRAFAERQVATFEELITSSAELGVTFMICEMGLRALGMTRDNLRNDIKFTEGGVVSFLNAASKDGAVVFI
ncbi:MAG: DsrE/DsrF/DrsH-like family protein [Rhodospirillaceae bacterium]|jgi:peroxiredoxin family protein